MLKTVFCWVKKFQRGLKYSNHNRQACCCSNKEKHWCPEVYGRRRWVTYYFPNSSYYKHFRKDLPSYSDWPYEIKEALCWIGTPFVETRPQVQVLRVHQKSQIVQSSLQQVKLYSLSYNKSNCTVFLTTSQIVQSFLQQVKVIPLEHLPYFPDLGPCDFFLFPLLKQLLAGDCYANRSTLGSAIFQCLNSIPRGDYSAAFKSWIARLQKSVSVRGPFNKSCHWSLYA